MRTALNVIEVIVGVALIVGMIWLKFKMAERSFPGLDRKSNIQTLFGDDK